MKLEKRLMVKFLAGVFFLAFFLAASFVTFYYFASLLKEEQRSDLFPEEILQRMVAATDMQQGKPVLPPSWEKKLKRRNEWVQILNKDGVEVFHYNTPDSIPKHYTPSQLVHYIRNSESIGYAIHTWYQSINNHTYTWILGRKNKNELLLKIKKHTIHHNQTFTIPHPLLEEVKKRKGWIQIIDKNGAEIYQYRRPKNMPTKYTPGEYVHAKRSGSDLHFTSGRLNGQEVTWIMKEDILPVHEMEQNKIIASLFFASLVLIPLAFWLFSYHFGQKLGSPLLFLMDWLENLSHGIYKEPTRKSGPIKDPQTGQLKKPYVLYQEVFKVVEQLSIRLQEVQTERERLDHTREEWIAGVSHDLKTPLSTIKGYAELYKSPSYQWSQQEMEEYLDLVIHKAEDIQHLIDDLSLTFRIKNNALPLELTYLDMKEFLRLLVADVLNTIATEEVNIHLELPHDTTVMYPIDPQWFKRALMNLITNAIFHNDPNTPITVKLQETTSSTPNTTSALKIELIDQGCGMDEQTVSRLFQRYYQGTRTKRSKRGTGLGMAIAKQLIELHGGKIEIRSQVNRGTHVTITLPPKRKETPEIVT
ncbi:sensor histidine kinase [Laceyella tengchongensis]|jgi:two-component system, OmpR family, sensor kinase